MKIETYILARNESRMLPYTIRHYKQFSHIIVLENNSTDDTIDVAHRLGAEVRVYAIADEIDEFKYLEIKETCWNGSRADWVIVADADEFVYHPNIIDELEHETATVIHPKFINMFSDAFPTTPGQIYDEIKYGTDGDFWYSKMNVFRPSCVYRMNWSIGCHHANPYGSNILINDKTPIRTLHMKFLSPEYVYQKNLENFVRLSKLNIDNGWGVQYKWTLDEIKSYFELKRPSLNKIIP